MYQREDLAVAVEYEILYLQVLAPASGVQMRSEMLPTGVVSCSPSLYTPGELKGRLAACLMDSLTSALSNNY